MHLYDGRVVSNLVVQALTGRPITLYGEGRQTRAFCYVDDLVDAMLLFMDAPDGMSGPINLGNPEEIAIGDLAALVVELTGSPSRIEHRPLPQDDPVRRLPDIALARKALGWEPRVSLREGLGRTIGYFRAVLGVAVVAGGGETMALCAGDEARRSEALLH
jgi:UDP-glucuronate decarboxylase